MFHFDNGLKLTAIDLAVDVRRRQPRGFVSHAHADHMARHELMFCTPATAKLCWHRLGRRRTVEMPFGDPLEWDHLQLTALPAGHVLGSAMLLADDGERRLLYTGDFKLGQSLTAQPAQLPPADVLIMECTFGDPRYRMPSRDGIIDRLLETVRSAFAHGCVPIIYAYVLGKAQEVTKILTAAGIGVQQHPLAFAVSEIYRACGCDLGDFSRYEGTALPGHVVIAPPRSQRAEPLTGITREMSVALTGWAVDPRVRFRLGVDVALPLSDHADFDELHEAVQRVQPQVVYCTHGPASFVERLRERGHNAYRLERCTQLRLF